MIRGLSGSLFSHDLLVRLLSSPGALDSSPPAAGGSSQKLRGWYARIHDSVGPASGPRRVYDLVAEPLVRALGFAAVPVAGTPKTMDALLYTGGVQAAVLIVPAWGEPADAVWRHAIHRGLAHGARWCVCVNGCAVRLFDVHRAYARRHAEFDLRLALEDDRTFAVLWGTLHASAVGGGSGASLLDRIVRLSEQHRADVRRSLRDGVQDALVHLVSAFRAASKRQADGALLDESLIVVYRLLFLLFAEARGLVPRWHPVYRESYTVETLGQELERPGTSTGVWEALQAIARLAHGGCRAGALRVPPFNGRLFSPSDAPLADTLPLDDRAVGLAVTALTTRRARGGMERISYGDLGVEQLGAVYEHLLDFDLATREGVGALLVRSGRRKATGSFYTPRSLTEFLVRRTLAPLAAEATPEGILRLRVLDPAMGSGAFLVAACRYLAWAYEQAVIREGSLAPSDMDDSDRAGFRRAVAQQCLYGVDVNPMAVQLGRLSLWLATLAADKPLTFLDHHLRSGNSLVGGSLEAIVRQPAPGRGAKRPADLPLFAGAELQVSLGTAVGTRLHMAGTPDDTIEQVRGKERALASLSGPGGALTRWRGAADLWCAAWYGPRAQAPAASTFRALLDTILQGGGALPRHVANPIVSRARDVAIAERFFHWPFEFPEVFHDEQGAPRADGGFDAIVGNPPWEMLREDRAAFGRSEFSRFVRGSGVYRLQGSGHGNLYQLFLERALHLLKPAGRSGMILPSGFATDSGGATLRRQLLERTHIETFTTIENRNGIFPIHRGLKFLLITLTNAGTTPLLPVRTGVRSTETLDLVPDSGPDAATIAVPRSLVERVSGDGLAIPEIRGTADLDILSSIAFRVRSAGDPDGWHVRFGRELNVTDDRPHFTGDARGLPVLEGKHLRAFGVDADACRYRIPARTAARLFAGDATYRRARLAYREVAAPTNRTTLIAAIVPAGVVTSHTVFCLKTPLDADAQEFLCGIFNSYVANYLIRMRVGTHVTAAIVSRLPVPRPSSADPRYRRIAAISRSLARAADAADLARLNALAAELYGLSERQFEHVLDTFPLVPATERIAAQRMFEAKDW